MTKTQTAAIEKHLRSGKSLTAVEALNKFGCFRLAARCHELIEEGKPIGKIMVKRGQKRFASYFLRAARGA